MNYDLSKKKKKQVLITIGIIIILVVVGGIVFFFIRSNSTFQDKGNKKNNTLLNPNADNYSDWYKKFVNNTSKTKNDDKLFYYTWCLEIGEIIGFGPKNYRKRAWRMFRKEKNGFRYELSIVANHPSLTNVPFPLFGKIEDETGRYYQIEGINFADFTQKEMRDGPYFEKKIDLENKDKIIVTPVNP